MVIKKKNQFSLYTNSYLMFSHLQFCCDMVCEPKGLKM